jgi:predicted nucleic acid-binding protein
MEQDRVFDTSALIAFIEDEPEAAEVADLIERASNAKSARLVSVVNLGEFWYRMTRKRLDADQGVNGLISLDFTIVDVDWELTRTAAELKLKYKLGFADSFAAALAKLHKCELVVKDNDFRKLGREIRVRMLK